MHTLSGQAVSESLVSQPMVLTDVVRLIENHDALLAHFRRDVLCDLRIEEVVEGINHDVEVWQLRTISIA